MKRKLPATTPEENPSIPSEPAAEEAGVVVTETVQTFEATEAPAAAVAEPETGSMQAVECAAAEAETEAGAAAVEPARPRLGEYLEKTVYGACYYVAYGVVYGALSVARVIPMDNMVGRAIKDGATDARKAVERQAEAAASETAAMEEPSPLGA